MIRVCCLLLSLLWCLPGAAAIDVYQFDSARQEQRFRTLTEELRCPKCQNQSIADSDAGISQDMRDRVQSMIVNGKTDEEIVTYFVSRYGDFVSYRPPVNSHTAILWAGPLGLLLLGVGVIATLLLRASRNADAEPENGEGPSA